MTVSQITTVLNKAGYTFSSNEVEIGYGKIHKIITDLENPVFVDQNTRVVFHKMSGGGVMSVYYKPAETKPDFIIPFSTIYGFEFRLDGGAEW